MKFILILINEEKKIEQSYHVNTTQMKQTVIKFINDSYACIRNNTVCARTNQSSLPLPLRLSLLHSINNIMTSSYINS